MNDLSDAQVSGLTAHAYALEVSGYTIVSGQVSEPELEVLRSLADQALARTAALLRDGHSLTGSTNSKYYQAARCMYGWGDAFMRLLENDMIHSLASLAMDSFQLWDMLVMSALPAPDEAVATTSWHRDFDGMLWGTQTPAYLWCFLCLDDVTQENGATWVIPGSHRIRSRFEPDAGPTWGKQTLENYHSRLQLCAKAGDFLILNPTILHSSGHNHTDKARRLLNIGLCHRALQPLVDHWAIAAPSLKEGAGERLRYILNADRKPLDRTWAGLPE